MSKEIKVAMDVLKESMKDEGYRRSWYCNIAMPCQDSGVNYVSSQEIAGRIMSALFGQNCQDLINEYCKSYHENSLKYLNNTKIIKEECLWCRNMDGAEDKFCSVCGRKL